MKFYIFALFIFVTACVSAPVKKKPTPQAQTNVRSEYNRALQDVRAGQDAKAITKLKSIIQKHPHTDVSHDAKVVLGKLQFKQKDYVSAYNNFISVVDSPFFSPNEGEALVLASKSLARQGRVDEALHLAKKLSQIPGLKDPQKHEAYQLQYQLFIEIGDFVDALRSASVLVEKEKSYEQRGLDILQNKLSRDDLKMVSDDKAFGNFYVYANFFLGKALFEQMDYNRSRDNLNIVISAMPNSEWAQKAQTYINTMESSNRVESSTIGVILPLTGKQREAAYGALRGIQMGLGVFGPKSSRMKLAIMDSEGSPEVAQAAVERLVNEDHVVAIIGGLLSKTAVNEATRAQELGVPFVALSQKAGLTDIGGGVFRNTLTGEQQVQELVRIAMEKFNMKRFAVMFPNDTYGTEYTNAFWDEVNRRGGKVNAAQTYNNQEMDFNKPMKRLVGIYYLEDRLSEYKLRLKEWFDQKKVIKGRMAPPDDLLPPLVDFDALFIPDSTKALGQIAPMLAFHNVRNVRLLGTNVWNSDDLIRRGQKHVEGSIFLDTAWSQPAIFQETGFYKDFVKTFEQPPSSLEAVAFEAGWLVREAAANGSSSRAQMAQSLAGLKNVTTTLGSLALNDRREWIRPLQAFTVQQGQIVSLDSATETKNR